MLKRGSIVLSIWSGINFLLAALILTSVVIFSANSPLLVMVFERSEIAGQKWAFWVLLFVIGFVEVMASIASAGVGNVRWQVNVVQSVLYVVGIGLSGYAPLFSKRQAR